MIPVCTNIGSQHLVKYALAWPDLSEQLPFETLTVAGHRYLWLTGMLKWAFEIELSIVKQGEFELAADLGWVRHIQDELSSTVPMGPTPVFR
jgi:hypothetical protein